MKLSYITTSEVDTPAANVVHVMRMANALANHIDVELIHRRSLAKPRTMTLPYEDYEVRPHFSGRSAWWPQIPFIGALVYTASVVKGAWPQENTFHYGRHDLSIFILALLGRPTAWEAHSLPRSAFKRWLLGVAAKTASFKGVVSISEALKSDLVDAIPTLSSDAVLVAHDGADAPPDPLPQLQSWKGRPSSIQIGYTGHLYEGRGIEIILELAEAFPEADFQIVGGNFDLVSFWEPKSPANVHFYGHVANRLVASYVAKCDIMLAPYQKRVSVSGNKGDTSRWMSPLKIFEYMSSGKCIICSDIPVLREVLNHEVNALLASPDDHTQWKEALARAIANADFRNSIGINAKTQFLSHYSWATRAKNVLKFCGISTTTSEG